MKILKIGLYIFGTLVWVVVLMPLFYAGMVWWIGFLTGEDGTQMASFLTALFGTIGFVGGVFGVVDITMPP